MTTNALTPRTILMTNPRNSPTTPDTKNSPYFVLSAPLVVVTFSQGRLGWRMLT
ncbi:uncharacterized protein BJX67DRAFT_368769 [Aspergillus lucknowensis]|uniref:Uncharacterized protein n=1 Tax=Aspergillus lucknowensis TaxID=176173 RepID=A0ABR4L5Q3_9EURO